MSTDTQIVYQIVFSTKDREKILSQEKSEELIELLIDRGIEFDERYSL